MSADARSYTLLSPDGRPYSSPAPGAFGGHRRSRIYGRLNCRTARRALANGGYVADRVFFSDETTAITAGYRPCGACLPEHYATWNSLKRAGTTSAALRAAYTAVRRLQDQAASFDAPRSLVLGHSRDLTASEAARLLRDHLLDRGFEVRDVVDWPEQAASWLRQATRFTVPAPELWIVLVADADSGWMELRQRLRDTDWDPDRTLVVIVRT